MNDTAWPSRADLRRRAKAWTAAVDIISRIQPLPEWNNTVVLIVSDESDG